MTEKQKLSQAVDEFADAMKARLMQKQKQGFHGWEFPESYDIHGNLVQEDPTACSG